MNNVERYWKQFTDSPSSVISAAERYRDSFFFGFSAEDAPEVSRLVLEGAKRATGSVLWSYEADGQALPQVGEAKNTHATGAKATAPWKAGARCTGNTSFRSAAELGGSRAGRPLW